MDSNQFLNRISMVEQSLLRAVPNYTNEMIDNCIRTAEKALVKWKSVSIYERADFLYKAADLLEQNREELVEVVLHEIGKDKNRSESEVIRSAAYLRETADTAKELFREKVRGDDFCGYDRGKFVTVQREPLGVVLAISPFHYPVYFATAQVAPALAMGNAVVWKPSSKALCSSSCVKELYCKAGIPEDLLQIVCGSGNEIGSYLVTHPSIDFIYFAGDAHIGNQIARHVPLMPKLMELGGTSAALVLEDADLDAAARKIAGGAFSFSGQHRTYAKRVFAVQKVHDQLMERLKEYMKHLVVGSPLEVNADVVPLIDSQSADSIWKMIQDSLEQGAVLAVGGKREGNLLYPTLLDKVTPEMKIAWEEPLGPVLPVLTVSDAEEAVKLMNQSEYFMQASVFSKDMDRAFSIAERLETGIVQINGKSEGEPVHLPFIGRKCSGKGIQDMRYSMEAMTRMKAKVISLTLK